MGLQDSYTGTKDTGSPVYDTGLYAQTFKASASYSVASVKVPLYETGNIGTNPITLSIYSTTGAAPNTTPNSSLVSVSRTDLHGVIGTTAGGSVYVEFTFASPYALTSGTSYAIVLSAPSPLSASNRVNWVSHAANGYADGRALSYAPSSWSAKTYDLFFETYVKDYVLATVTIGIVSDLSDTGLILDVVTSSATIVIISGFSVTSRTITKVGSNTTITIVSGLSVTPGISSVRPATVTINITSGLSVSPKTIQPTPAEVTINILSGLSVTGTRITGDFTFSSITVARPDSYDSDTVFSWTDNTWGNDLSFLRGSGGRYQTTLIAIDKDGTIYFGS